MKAAAIATLVTATLLGAGQVSAQKGVVITLKRYETSNTCNTGGQHCADLTPGMDPMNLPQSQLDLNGGTAPTCFSTSFTVTKATMGQCTKSLLGGTPHYYKLGCGNGITGEVVFTDYTDAQCLVPSMMPLGPSGVQIELSNMIISPQGLPSNPTNCTDMTALYTAKANAKMIGPGVSAVSVPSTANYQAALGYIGQKSWQMTSNHADWCKANAMDLDNMETMVITRYGASTACKSPVTTVQECSMFDPSSCKPLNDGTCATLVVGVAPPMDCAACNVDVQDCSTCAYCTVQTEKMDMSELSAAKGGGSAAAATCIPSSFGNQYMSLTCDGSDVKFSTYQDASCTTPMQMPTGILGHAPGTTTDCDDIVTMIPGTNQTQTINIAGVPFDCSDFLSGTATYPGAFCYDDGTVGPGWQSAWGPLPPDATNNCCACGGGTKNTFPITILLKDLSVYDNGACTDLSAEFVKQLGNKVANADGSLTDSGVSDYEQAVVAVQQDMKWGWTLKAASGSQFCPQRTLPQAQAAVTTLSATLSQQQAILLEMQNNGVSAQLLRAQQAATQKCKDAVSAAQTVVHGFNATDCAVHHVTARDCAWSSVQTQKALQKYTDDAISVSRELISNVVIMKADKATNPTPTCTAPGVPVGCAAPHGVQIALSRYAFSRSCAVDPAIAPGKCTTLSAGQNANSADVQALPCTTQMIWVDRTQMDTCIDSAYGDDFFTLTCAGENVVFSDYTDAACTTPQSVPMDQTGTVSMTLDDLNVNDDGNCTDMTKEYIKKLNVKKVAATDATVQAALSSVIATISDPANGVAQQSWKLTPDVKGWCKKDLQSLDARYANLTITRYTSNNGCHAQDKNGNPTVCTVVPTGTVPPLDCSTCDGTYQNCDSCADCTISYETLDMENMHGKCIKSKFGPGWMKLNCDGSAVVFNRYTDVNCSTPVFYPTGETTPSGMDINIDMVGLSVFDNGICTNINAEYLKQLQAKLDNAVISDQDAYKNAIANVRTGMTQSWTITTSANAQFCPAKTRAQAAADLIVANDALNQVQATLDQATTQVATATAKAAKFEAQRAVAAAQKVVAGFDIVGLTGKSMPFTASASNPNQQSQYALQRLADYARVTARAAADEATQKLAAQGNAAITGDSGLTLTLSRFPDNNICAGTCTTLVEGQDSQMVQGCTTQTMTVDRTQMGQCIRSKFGLNDYYTLTCAGENVIFSDYTDPDCTIAQSFPAYISPEGKEVDVTLQYLSVNDDGQCTDMGAEFKNRLKLQLDAHPVGDPDNGIYQNAYTNFLQSSSWQIVPSKSGWCNAPKASLDTLSKVTMVRYDNNNDCSNVPHDLPGGTAYPCVAVVPGGPVPVSCSICDDTDDNPDNDCAGCANCTTTTETWDMQNMHGTCVQSQYGTGTWLMLSCDGPDVKFSVFGDSACASPLVVYTGVQDASGNDIVVKQQDLTVLDNGVCSDLNAEYVGQIQNLKAANPYDPNYRVAIETVKAFTQSWIMTTPPGMSFCPARDATQAATALTSLQQRQSQVNSALAASTSAGSATAAASPCWSNASDYAGSAVQAAQNAMSCVNSLTNGQGCSVGEERSYDKVSDQARFVLLQQIAKCSVQNANIANTANIELQKANDQMNKLAGCNTADCKVQRAKTAKVVEQATKAIAAQGALDSTDANVARLKADIAAQGGTPTAEQTAQLTQLKSNAAALKKKAVSTVVDMKKAEVAAPVPAPKASKSSGHGFLIFLMIVFMIMGIVLTVFKVKPDLIPPQCPAGFTAMFAVGKVVDDGSNLTAGGMSIYDDADRL